MFHPKTGEMVILSNGSRTAQRSHPGQEFNNGLVMSLEPLRDNHLFEVRIDKKINSWTGTIEIGVTTCDPNSLQFPMTAAMLPPVTWLVSGVSVLRDGQPILEDYVQNLECLGEGDTVGVMKTSEGELHFYVNGVDQGTAVSNVPAKVYAVIDLYGKCAQVTALETTNESRIHSNALSNISAVTSSMYNSRNSSTNSNNNNDNNNNAGGGDENISFDNAVVVNESVAVGNDANLSTSDKLRFHERTGTLVKLTNNGRTAERSRPQDEFNNGVVMTHRSLRDNELFEIRIDRLVDKWSGSIEVGVTTHNPAALEFPATMTNMRSGTIMMSGCGILTNGKGTRREYGVYNLDELMEGDCISLMRKGNANLHYYINGIDQGVAASKVPTTVFAVVDLYGMTVKVSIVDHDDRLEQGLANHRNNTLIREYHLLNGLATYDELEDDRLLFDTRCGSHAAVINGGHSAHRPIAVEDFDNAVVLTSRPLRAGELFEVRLDAVVPKWAGSIEIGVTTHSPRLLDFPSTMTNLCSGNWMMTGKGVMHNGTATIEEYGQNLDRLTVGNRVGVLRKENGDLHFFVNGVDQGVASTNVPEKVFGVVDLYGQATRCTIVDHQESTYDSANAGVCPSFSPSSELRFHYLRGRNARISSCGMIASRPKANIEFNDAIVISNRPLRDNEMFEVTLDKMVDRWSGSIEAGVTAVNPENLEFPSTMTDIDHDTWMLSGSSVMQNGSTIRNNYKCDLDSMEATTKVGMMRHADATLHYYINGEDVGVACSDIPQSVYAVIDLYGQCAQVTIIPPPSMTDSILSPPTHTETLRLSLGETTDATHHFSACCGKHVVLCYNNVIATRCRGFNHGLVFSSAPLQSNEMFEVQVQQVSRHWSGSLQIGLTTLHYTDGLPASTLPCSASQLPATNGDTWLLTGTRVRRNSTVLRDNYGPSLERLDVGDRVGVRRCADGTMHAFYNGRDIGVAATNLPKKLYAVVDLYGSVEKVSIVSKACGGLITPLDIRGRRTSSHSSHSRDSLEDQSVHEFHEVHGRNVILSNGNTVARRSASYNQGVAFSRKPLVKGQLFQFRIDRLNSSWSSSLLVGVTSHSPCRGTLPVNSLDLRRSTWIVGGNSVYHNGIKVKARYGPHLDSLQARHVVGVLVDVNNQLHLYVNRLDQGVAAKDIPQPCYAVVDLYGQCEELTVISTDSSTNHVIDTNHCEKANFEHGWKEKASKPPFVDQLLVKNCQYQNACIRFKSSLGLPDGYFLPEHSVCYCDTCYKIRGDEAYYRKGEPPKDYAVPFGWCQFSLRIPVKADSSGMLDKWHIAFHGTRPAAIRRILDCGDLLIPEEAGLCSIARNVSSKNKSKDVDDEAIEICFSPTIRYAANSTFTPKFVDAKTKSKSFARCAFQVLAQPGAYNSGPQRLGAREPIDGHFSNSDIEWFTKERGATILHSLLVRIEDL